MIFFSWVFYTKKNTVYTLFVTAWQRRRWCRQVNLGWRSRWQMGQKPFCLNWKVSIPQYLSFVCCVNVRCRVSMSSIFASTLASFMLKVKKKKKIPTDRPTLWKVISGQSNNLFFFGLTAIPYTFHQLHRLKEATVYSQCFFFSFSFSFPSFFLSLFLFFFHFVYCIKQRSSYIILKLKNQMDSTMCDPWNLTILTKGLHKIRVILFILKLKIFREKCALFNESVNLKIICVLIYPLSS